MCQSLRIISFTVTQLPAPNYHCRIPEVTAIKPMPEHWWGHLYIQNIAKQVRASWTARPLWDAFELMDGMLLTFLYRSVRC